ncbi:iron-sulfur cluster assembly protein [Halococcus sediminicola]|uniref:iron-sulfur cluster assembly protein n=1 Tax=Halococcus sediminicola TaxID=1264579 RepID=UPI0006795F5A|nr:iron-sulfur cluster assembly protein [Halococcus sediminicola]
MATTTKQPTTDDVRARLESVDDPELDESIVDLEYIHDLTIDGSKVSVTLVLPTAWCSPAFAWMMATGARDELEALSEVDTATITLEDHMHATEINRGVNERLDFEMVFEEAEDDIEAVRRTLAEKARMSRQYHAIDTLLDAGLDAEQIVNLTHEAIDLPDGMEGEASVYLADDSFAVSVSADPLADYLKKATEVGIVEGPTDRVFATVEEDPIVADELDREQRRARLTGATVSGQGAICEGLNKARKLKGD